MAGEVPAEGDVGRVVRVEEDVAGLAAWVVAVGAAALAESLKQNTTLMTLQLYST